jgi:hypothetical protein
MAHSGNKNDRSIFLKTAELKLGCLLQQQQELHPERFDKSGIAQHVTR